ncbi:BZ3500_MvSof-1268-A1-R1_Chr2-2g05016 [Microbotryum saponariae]|uniref:BZ3500_MvSof-1268-A1-R1_Chr2-2g05016 protein n=2 Tax=Microbotryum saponariae TaxID=289078 RepID=A0A2X0M075_9BASI|nr:BZ3500_MvSof-1268-A1-R1_Chr2-2g05016 [Microbotryum saponariae]SCZ96964.1 BZ3501_MvSof-1269-A2-R1_Chr1-2g00879 [Microbotryum saponariae]SDA00709.1 BZ3501_MvSof-1269-A2-R1_Chr2-2g04690 [Microbotryum saponariae]
MSVPCHDVLSLWAAPLIVFAVADDHIRRRRPEMKAPARVQLASKQVRYLGVNGKRSIVGVVGWSRHSWCSR